MTRRRFGQDLCGIVVANLPTNGCTFRQERLNFSQIQSFIGKNAIKKTNKEAFVFCGIRLVMN